jgi:hypothetical protein
MRRIHVITQSKRDYDTERYNRLRFIWWTIASALFTSLFYIFIKSLSTLFYVWAGFIFLFVVSDLTKDQRTKSYIQVFLGILYGIWGLLFLLGTIIYQETTDERIFGFILTAIFLYIAYKKINKYTDLFDTSRYKRILPKKTLQQGFKINKPSGQPHKPRRSNYIHRKGRRRYRT